ncbi:hypothetical protein EIP91_007497 [Steccherinum ochraceum]|uniref:Uncharacterized protein n=1 Tax=Steccherinum ochraceum TaxID=92696 RepID=A0A4R0R9X1_9APHY|nr:hypothetical protein EIP91_007497 [Steccherinum ochraceum]
MDHSRTQVLASPVTLPFDVLEEIVAHLAIDPGDTTGQFKFADQEWQVKIRTLKACSLVCRDLLHCSRRHLFRDLSLRSAEELEEFIASREDIPWLSSISTLWVYGSDWDQSWISVVPFSLFPLLHLREIRLQGVDLRVIHPSAYKAFRLHGPQRWMFEDTRYSRYSQITQLLPPNAAFLAVRDNGDHGADSAKHTLLIEIWASSLSCIATYPIAQALLQLRGAFFHSIRIVICKEYAMSARFPPEVNPPLLDMKVLAARWNGVDAALARVNVQDFYFQCCLEPHVLPEGYTCTNELIRGLLPTFTSAVNLDGPACKSCHGFNSRCAYHRETAVVGRSPRFSIAVLERIVRCLVSSSVGEQPYDGKANARALSACSLVSRALMDCSRRQRFRTVTVRSEADLDIFTTITRATPRLSGCVEHLVVQVQGAPDLASQQWVSSIPSRLFPLRNLRQCTMKGVDLRTIRPSARQAFSSHGPGEWTFVGVKYAKFSQITQLLPANTTSLRIEELPDASGVNTTRYPGELGFRHVRGPLEVRWLSSWKHRETLAKCLNSNAVPRAGFDFCMDGWIEEPRVQAEDVAVVGYVRKAFERTVGSLDSRDADLRLQYLSKKFEEMYLTMQRSKEPAFVRLELNVATMNLGSITTSHISELLHHAASEVFDSFLLSLDANTTRDLLENSSLSSPDIKTLAPLWETIDTALASTNYPNIRTFDVRCHLAINALPTGYACVNELRWGVA